MVSRLVVLRGHVVYYLLVMMSGAIFSSISQVNSSNNSPVSPLEAVKEYESPSLSGYVWMVLNCITTASYVLYMRFATTKMSLKLSRFGMAFYNNLISSAILVPIMVFFGEAQMALQNPLMRNVQFLTLFLLSGLMGIALNLSSFWCVSVTSATTYAIVGALNKIPTTFVGVLILGENLSLSTSVFVFIGMLGGMLYAYAKFKEREKRKAFTSSLSSVSTSTVDVEEEERLLMEEGELDPFSSKESNST